MNNYKTHIRKHSVRLAGHQTSVSIENAFWDQLVRIAKKQDQSMNSLITQLDADRSGNLSSAIRIYVLNKLIEKKPISELT